MFFTDAPRPAPTPASGLRSALPTYRRALAVLGVMLLSVGMACSSADTTPAAANPANSNAGAGGGQGGQPGQGGQSGQAGQAGEAGQAGSTSPVMGKSVHHCLKPASASAPADLYQKSGVTASANTGLFTKKLDVYGLSLVAKADVVDEFLLAVSQTFREMFPNTASDKAGQKAVLSALYRHQATIPVFAGGEAGIDENAIASLPQARSVCDIIMQGSALQAMEVVEHVLHFASDIGLHQAFGNRWAMTDGSELYGIAQKAKQAGFYVENYDHKGVMLQEFAYWLVSSYWDLQTAYGPKEPEWTLRTPAALKESLPSGFALAETTINQVMAAPSKANLDGYAKWAKK